MTDPGLIPSRGDKSWEGKECPLGHGLTVGFGEVSHRDWLETQTCCWVHQKQGHCADRQLLQLEDKGLQMRGSPHYHPFIPDPAQRNLQSGQEEVEHFGGRELPDARCVQGENGQVGHRETKQPRAQLSVQGLTLLGDPRSPWDTPGPCPPVPITYAVCGYTCPIRLQS